MNGVQPKHRPMVIVHEDGHADVLHMEREHYLLFARIFNVLAGQFLQGYESFSQEAPPPGEAAPNGSAPRRKGKQAAGT